MTDVKIKAFPTAEELIIQVLPDDVPEPLKEYTLVLSEYEALTLLTAVFTIQAMLCGAKTDIADWVASEGVPQDKEALAGIIAQLALQNPMCLIYTMECMA